MYYDYYIYILILSNVMRADLGGRSGEGVPWKIHFFPFQFHRKIPENRPQTPPPPNPGQENYPSDPPPRGKYLLIPHMNVHVFS